MKEFSELLEELRVSKKMSKKDLANFSGLTASYVSQLTRGEKRFPSEEVVLALAKGLGLDWQTERDLLESAGYSPVGEAVGNNHSEQEDLDEVSHSAPRSFDEIIPARTISEIRVNNIICRVFLTIREITNTLLEQIDSAMHSVTGNNLIGALVRIRTIQSNSLILLSGASGSDINVIKQILAYRMGQTESSIPNNSDIPVQLNEYQLWEASIDRLSEFSRTSRTPINNLLKWLKREAVRSNAVLLLTEFEKVRRESPVGKRIKEQLSHPENACIICCYRYDSVKPSNHELTFGLTNGILINAQRMSTERQLREFIYDYHCSRWRQQGYEIDENAFSSLFLLEKGIWIGGRRKTWPYLGIDLVDDCITTARGGRPHIRELARDARDAIDDLLTKEVFKAKETDRQELDPVLQAVQKRIEALCENQDLPQRDNLVIITQSLIEAQLFCRNDSEFHYPSVRP